MHRSQGSQSPLEIWQLGMAQLTKSEAEPALLGLAMTTIHGALEKQFRQVLSSLPGLSEAERMRAQDRKEVNWPQLRDLMQRYLGLSDSDARYIMQMNSIRNEVAHEGVCRASYEDVAAYSDFVKRWLDVTEQEWFERAEKEGLGVNEERTTQGRRSFANCCPRCQSMNVKSLEVIYERGITYIERGRGTEVRQFGSSLRAAPPKKKKYLPEMNPRWWLLAIFLFPFVFALASFLILFLPFWFYWVWKYNTTEYPRRLEEWRKTFKCEQCAHTFLLATLK